MGHRLLLRRWLRKARTASLDVTGNAPRQPRASTRIVRRWYERACRGQMSSFPYLSEYAAQQREVQLGRLRDAEHVDLCIAEGARDLQAGQLEPGLGRGIFVRGALRPVVIGRLE